MSSATLIIKAKENGISSCYGLGEVEDRAVSWLCTGHSSDQKCLTAWIMWASEGDHFIDEKSNLCFITKKNRIESCKGFCVGTWDIETWPSRSINEGLVRFTDDITGQKTPTINKDS